MCTRRMPIDHSCVGGGERVKNKATSEVWCVTTMDWDAMSLEQFL